MAPHSDIALAGTPAPRSAPPRPDAGRGGTARGRLLADRMAHWLVRAGGVAIIASILGILVFILLEVWPLGHGVEVSSARLVPTDAAAGGALVTDQYLTWAAVLAEDGVLRLVRLDDGSSGLARPLLDDGAALTEVATAGPDTLAGRTADGRIVAVRLGWEVSFVEQDRVVTPVPGDPVVFDVGQARPVGAWGVSLSGPREGTAAGQLPDGSIALVRRTVTENMLTGEGTEELERHSVASPYRLSVALLDANASTLYGGTNNGHLVWWPIDATGPESPRVSGGPGPAVTALTLLVGERSLVVGRADGTVGIWFRVRQPDESFRLTRIRGFASLTGAVRSLSPSQRNKGFLAQDDSGRLGLFYSTSERELWTGGGPLPGASGLYFTPRADAAVLGGRDGLALLEIDNPHPEVGWRAVFGRVWYEEYERPAHVWQSSGATDAFEPKLGLTPLMAGTLKGTLYSLILAIPLGVLGAMYTSQFMNPALKGVVKPVVEIMAALPSVVLGFLAGLWLAPRVERIVPGLALMLVVLPALILLLRAGLAALPRGIRNRVFGGVEVLLYMLVLAGGIALCIALDPIVEGLVFGGSFQGWLLETTGLRYDQRNALVVGLAMGFAVIPVIFAIAEDAFSNVPRNLVSGSLALGANRWQTVTRVVLPTASPGIFSAIMIGFGRAVGETMIVLMATGNTPIMDWNPFNGFRTLSANIAVEIPEAPQGSTLYRMLFLAALILFAFTFLVNTVAELIRQRLRRRYAEL